MNFLNNKNEFMMCDDKTGNEISVQQRIDAVTVVQQVQDLTLILFKTNHPVITDFQMHFALRSICLHLGWEPHVIASMVQYLTLTKTDDKGMTPITG